MRRRSARTSAERTVKRASAWIGCYRAGADDKDEAWH
jgi:hypothetical protein